MKGFYFLNGKKVEPRYADVRLLKGGTLLAVKTSTGKIGYIGSNGIEYFVE